MANKRKKVNDIKEYLFNLWKTIHFVNINELVFNTSSTVLAYNPDTQVFEIFPSSDTELEKAIWTVKKDDIITINNQEIILNAEIKNIINNKWATSEWIKINGFTFFTDECFQLFTCYSLMIFDYKTDKQIINILINDINSLETNNEVIL